MSAIDLSEDLIQTQRQNNSFISKYYIGDLCEMKTLEGVVFDLVLMIDVIEHIDNNEKFSRALNKISQYILYNIPIEINFFDLVRNFLMRNRYYNLQSQSIGHVHFFSYRTSLEYILKFHNLVAKCFSGYADYYLKSMHNTYYQQRKSNLRRLELYVASFIESIFPSIAPYIVPGSTYILTEAKK